MIQLTNLQRLLPRVDVLLQSGYDQDIYRVLAIAQTNILELYSAAEVIRLGWQSTAQKDAYQYEYSVLYAWANKKNITGTSQNMDLQGRAIKPAKWTGENWQSEVAHKLWNMAANIINGAFDLQQSHIAEGRTGMRYWYDENFGVMAVSEEKQARMITIANLKFSVERAERKGHRANSDLWKDELAALLSEQAKSNEHQTGAFFLGASPTPARRKRLTLGIATTACVLLILLGVFSMRTSDSKREVPPNAIASLPQELSISEATILTLATPEKATSKRPLNPWESYARTWHDDRQLTPIASSEYAPPLFLNCPIVLASLP